MFARIKAATFGQTKIGTENCYASSGYIATCEFTLSEEGTIDSIYFCHRTTTGNNAYLYIYDDNSSEPNNLIRTSSEINLPETNGDTVWIGVDITDTTISAGTYHVGYNVEYDSGTCYFQHSSAGSNIFTYRVYSYNVPPNPFGTPSGHFNDDFSIYVVYKTRDSLYIIAGTGGTVAVGNIFDTCIASFYDTAIANELYQFWKWNDTTRNNLFTITTPTPYYPYMSADPVDCAASYRDTLDVSFLPKIAYDTTTGNGRTRLVFLHHSTGGYLLANVGETNGGGLGALLAADSFEVYDVNYTAYNRDFAPSGNTGISDYTDIGHWYTWFVDTTYRDNIQACVDTTSNRTNEYGSYDTLLGNTDAENRIIMIKSCYPNSNIYDSNSTVPSDLYGRAYNYQSGEVNVHTITNIKALYREMLSYMMTRPEKMYVILAQPPLSSGNTTAGRAANARELCNWLYFDWLNDSNWVNKNVYVFPYYNNLTSDSNMTEYRDSTIHYLFVEDSNYLAYPTGDDHPSTAGQQKAANDLAPILKGWYNRYLDWYSVPQYTIDTTLINCSDANVTLSHYGTVDSGTVLTVSIPISGDSIATLSGDTSGYSIGFTKTITENFSVTVTFDTIPTGIMFRSTGTSFNPRISNNGAFTMWVLGDDSLSFDTLPNKTYPSAGNRWNRLIVSPWDSLKKINLGYDGGDSGGTYNPTSDYHSAQAVDSVTNITIAADSLYKFYASHTDLRYADFTNCNNLDAIEFYYGEMIGVNLTGCQNIRRVCFEACDLPSLDVSDCDSLEDIRGRANEFTHIIFPEGGLNNLWHLCIGSSSLLDSVPPMSLFPAMNQLWTWDGNIRTDIGATSANTALTNVRIYGNEHTTQQLENLIDTLLVIGNNDGILQIQNNGCGLSQKGIDSIAVLESRGWTVDYDTCTHTVTVQNDGNGTTSPTTDTTVVAGTPVNLVATPSQYFKFSHWTIESGNGTWDPDSVTATTQFTPSEDATVQAHFEAFPTYTVTYDPGEGTGSVVDPSSPYDSSATVTVLSATGMEYIGHDFTGWNTEAGGGGVSYDPTDQFNISSNVTLYAQWTPTSLSFDTVMVFLAIGQSNMDSRADDTLAPTDSNRFYAEWFDTDRDSIVLDTINGVNAIGYGVNGNPDYDGTLSKYVFPEAFTNRLRTYYPNYTFVIVNAAKGGTASINWSDTSVLFQNAVLKYDSTVALLSRLSNAVLQGGVMVAQGESDADAGTSIADFKAAWNSSIDTFRTNSDYDSIPWSFTIIGGYGNGSNDDWANTRQAIEELEDTTNFIYVRSNAANYGRIVGNEVHYDSAGQVRHGYQHADVFAWHYGLLPSTGGCRVDSLLIANDQKTLSIELINLSSNLTPSETDVSGFLFTDNGSSVVPTNIDITGANTITATFDDTLIGPVVASFIYNKNYDTAYIPANDSGWALEPFQDEVSGFNNVVIIGSGTGRVGRNVDTYIYGSNNDRCYGEDDVVWSTLANRRGLLVIDMRPLHGLNVTSAKMYTYSYNGTDTGTLEFHELNLPIDTLQPFEEPAASGQATWRRRIDFNGAGGDETWSAGNFSSADYNATAICSLYIDKKDVGTEKIADFTYYISTAVGNDSDFIYLSSNCQGIGYRIYSLDATDESLRWFIRVETGEPVVTIDTTWSGSFDSVIVEEGLSVTPGTVVHFRAYPADGWVFGGYGGDVSSSSAIDSFTVNSNTSVTVTALQIPIIDSIRPNPQYRSDSCTAYYRYGTAAGKIHNLTAGVDAIQKSWTSSQADFYTHSSWPRGWNTLIFTTSDSLKDTAALYIAIPRKVTQ